ncbi:unnamed protein product [Leptidea sinapis]|uniref:UDP-glycosyltransferase n=1 Tax=Leptidea sinapis TaxID=189913 RepID=A0A5E4QRB4_9NEOP|nr:unnamed protein product [Leptidea sinapis]
MPSISHQKVFRPLTKELARRGHEVVVITPDPGFPKGKTPANLTEIDIHDISYKEWQKMFESHTGDKNDMHHIMELLFQRITETFEKQIQTPDVQRLIKEENNKFDLLILEACIRPSLGLAHVFKVPVIHFSSFGAVSAQYNLFGAPMHPILYPSAPRLRIYDLTLWEKAKEYYNYFYMDWLIKKTADYDYEMVKRNFGNDAPSFDELYNRIELLFLNEHHIWADNHPVPPNIVFIGGIEETQKNNLSRELQHYLDSSRYGVIYVSFGTNIMPSLLPRDKINVMAKVLSEIPYDILWKWDSGTVPSNSRGLHSTQEAISAGVPMIGMPMLGDQWYNVEKYLNHKFGLQLDIMTITEETLSQSLDKILYDPR